MLDDDVEEHRRHLDMIIECCQEIKNSSGYDVRRVFSRVGNAMDKELSQIRKHEQRINENQKEQINSLGVITQRKKDLATELRAVIDRVKGMDYEAKDLTNACQTKNHEYEEKMKDATGTALVSKLKTAIVTLKGELKESRLSEGVMNNMLFSCEGMRRGKHHLFDEIANPVMASAAADTKNNTEEA